MDGGIRDQDLENNLAGHLWPISVGVRSQDMSNPAADTSGTQADFHHILHGDCDRSHSQ